MRRTDRFILTGAESYQNSEAGNNKESFQTVEELINYVKFMNYRTEYLGVFDRSKKKEINLGEHELV